MKINISELFPVTLEELNEFEKLVESSTEIIPEGGFERLMAAKEADKKLSAFQEGITRPTSFGILVEIIATSLGKNRFRLADELKTNGSIWNKVILTQDRPDIIPASTYATFAKAFRISFDVLKCSLEGSFRLIQSGVSGTGAVFTRSDRNSTINTDVSAAMQELLRKAGKTTGTLDSKALAFLKEIESWMKK
jgi:hypothetical protein